MASFRERPPRFLFCGVTPENKKYVGHPLLCLSNMRLPPIKISYLQFKLGEV
jgi:hypothetical protein